MGFLTHFAFFLAATSVVTADVAAPANAPKVTSVTYSGSGCANNAKFSGTFNDPTLTFSTFAASLPGNQTVNCQVHIQASGTSPGWQVAVNRNVVKGHLVLAPGTSLTHYTTIYYSQDAARTVSWRLSKRHPGIELLTASAQDSFTGTITNSDSDTFNDAITLVGKADADRVWSPCTGDTGYTGILNINFRGALSGDGKAYFEANTEEWDLVWRKC